MKKLRRFLFDFLIYTVTYWMATLLQGDVRWTRSLIFYLGGIVFYFSMMCFWSCFFAARRKKKAAKSENK